MSRHRHDIRDIDFHCRGLLNQTDTQYQTVALFFAQENPVNSL